jgi:hypothetical protein
LSCPWCPSLPEIPKPSSVTDLNGLCKDFLSVLLGALFSYFFFFFFFTTTSQDLLQVCMAGSIFKNLFNANLAFELHFSLGKKWPMLKLFCFKKKEHGVSHGISWINPQFVFGIQNQCHCLWPYMRFSLIKLTTD